MNFFDKRILVLISFGLGVVYTIAFTIGLSGCARSGAFQDDRQQYRDYPHGYYGQHEAGDNPTRKIELVGQPKKKLFVFDFWNDTPVQSSELGPFIGDELKREFYNSNQVLMPEGVQSKMGTQDFVDGDTVKVEQLVREGKRLGVAAVVIGRIRKIAYRVRGSEVGLFAKKQAIAGADVEIKLFNVETGREMFAVERSGQAVSDTLAITDSNEIASPESRVELAKLALRDAGMQLVAPVVVMVNKMSWQGRIAKITGNTVYINAGKASGLIQGDILNVIADGEEVYDPETGAFLGRTKGQVKGTLEVVGFIGSDAATGEIHTGGQFSEGDTVRLY